MDDVLRQVDLPEGRWEAPPQELSGGEGNRVRTATELIGDPRLFLLDEPTSGLDPDTETRLLSFLRSLSLRGSTVLVVIHSLQQLDLFDRVLVIGPEGLCYNGTPSELKRQIPSRNFLDLVPEDLVPEDLVPEDLVPEDLVPEDLVPSSATPTTATVKAAPPPIAAFRSSGPSQFINLLFREWTVLVNRPGKRLILPVFVVPMVFALAVTWVPSHQLELLGFLEILSVIWLGASLSAQAIAGEREVVDHERRLYLRLSAYVAAKTVVVYVLAVVQATVFMFLVWICRWAFDLQQLYGGFWPLLYVLPAACTAAGMGLVLSSAVGRNRLAAGFVLPLLMMVQMVFSVHVGGEGKALLHNAYESQNSLVRASYLTISRWADISLRSFAYGAMEHRAFSGIEKRNTEALAHDYAGRRRYAVLVLGVAAFAAPLAVCILLSLPCPSPTNRRNVSAQHCHVG